MSIYVRLMSPTRACACAAALILALTGIELAAQSGYDLYQKALAAERADGDLRGAIQLYEQVVQRAGRDRALAARALVRMADCHQKLGEAAAVRIWQSVVRDFADQPESVAAARARLGDRTARAAGTTALTTRHILTTATAALNVESSVSPDGRYLPYTDWNSGGNLVLRDVATGDERRVTDAATYGTPAAMAGRIKEQYVKDSSFSRDGRQLAFAWWTGDGFELRVIALQEAGVPPFRRVFAEPDVEWITPHDWTPDAASILVSITRKDGRTQIGLVRLANGTVTVLKSVGERLWITRMFVSPDGRHAALDLQVDDRRQQRDVFVLALDGSGEMPAVAGPANDVVMGWSPDGRHLLFASDRNSGSVGLFAVPFVGMGTEAQRPRLIKANLEGSYPLGVTRSGSLVFASQNAVASYFDLRVAPVDLETGRLLAQPVVIGADEHASNESPAWSPDGQQLAYVSNRPAMSGVTNTVLVVHSLASGDRRELRPPLRRFLMPRWSPDGQALVVGGIDLRGRNGVFRVDAGSGEMSVLVISDAPTPWAAWSRDGASIYFKKVVSGATSEAAFVARNLASGEERELVRRKDLGELHVSPDGRYIATTSRDSGISQARPSSAAVLLIPTAGGQPRELVREDAVVNGPEWANAPVAMMAWAPDSQAVLAYKYASRPVPTMEVWRVALDGASRKLDWTARLRGQPSVHPDGRQIAFQVPTAATRELAFQVWSLDNFLSALMVR